MDAEGESLIVQWSKAGHVIASYKSKILGSFPWENNHKKTILSSATVMAPALNYESKATHAAPRKRGNSQTRKAVKKLSKKLIFISFLFAECQKRLPKSDKKELTKGSFINNTH